MIWINLFFLMCISFLPFSPALLSECGAYRHAVLVSTITFVNRRISLVGFAA